MIVHVFVLHCSCWLVFGAVNLQGLTCSLGLTRDHLLAYIACCLYYCAAWHVGGLNLYHLWLLWPADEDECTFPKYKVCGYAEVLSLNLS